MDYKKYIDEAKKFDERSKELSYPSYSMEKVQEYAEGLFTFAKFKAGDRVVMAETYVVNNASSGWMHIKHLMEKGSKATIDSVDWYNSKFVYLIAFDEKSYLNDKDEAVPCSSVQRVMMAEKWLELSSEPVGVINSLLDDIKEKSKALSELLSKLGDK